MRLVPERYWPRRYWYFEGRRYHNPFWVRNVILASLAGLWLLGRGIWELLEPLLTWLQAY